MPDLPPRRSSSEWTCPHGVTYTGSEDFISGARNAHGEYEAAVAVREPTDVMFGFKPKAEDESWTVRRCPLHELVVTDDEFCPVLLADEDVRCNAPLSDPFAVR